MRFWTWLIVRLLLALVLVGWVYSYLFLPSSGEREFRRTLEALKKVDSIHFSLMGDVPAQHSEQQADLVCSEDSFRRQTHIIAHQEGKDYSVDMETVRTGGKDYQLQPNGTWKRGYSGMESAKATCQKLAQGAANWIVPDFAELLQHSVIEKGGKKTLNGDVCREWLVTYRRGMTLDHRSICIGVNDHLPREVIDPGTATRWVYAFNIPTQIEAPTNLVPEPVTDTYRPPAPTLTLSDEKDDR